MNNDPSSISIDGPRPSSSWLLCPPPSPSVLLAHSNLCLLLIPPMRLRSLSNSITVDLMATEKIEDTDNRTIATPWMPFHATVRPTLITSNLSLSLFAWSEK